MLNKPQCSEGPPILSDGKLEGRDGIRDITEDYDAVNIEMV